MAKTVQEILDIASDAAAKLPIFVQSRLDEIQFASGFAEPGYDDEGKQVLLGNWNKPEPWGRESLDLQTVDKVHVFWSGLIKALEKVAHLEWHDEWAICCDCNKAVRTSPTHYGWTASFSILNDCELVCHECLDAEEALKACEGNDRTAFTMRNVEPEEYGYIKINANSYECGFHHGQTDDPKEIGARLRSLGISRYLFQIDRTGQFDVEFSLYIHQDQKKKIRRFTG